MSKFANKLKRNMAKDIDIQVAGSLILCPNIMYNDFPHKYEGFSTICNLKDQTLHHTWMN